MAKISNKNARKLVKARIEFTGSNTFARWVDDDNYVVYSYGTHFPMFLYKQDSSKVSYLNDGRIVHGSGNWYVQTSKYSKSTSRHYNQLHPKPAHYEELKNVAELKRYISYVNK